MAGSKGRGTGRDSGRLTRLALVVMGLMGVGALALRNVRGDDEPPRANAPKGRIFVTTAAEAKDGARGEAMSLVAIDPENGERTTVLERCGARSRVSPDGRTVAFGHEGSLWTRSVKGGDKPVKVLDLDGASANSPPAWSGDGKRILSGGLDGRLTLWDAGPSRPTVSTPMVRASPS